MKIVITLTIINYILWFCMCCKTEKLKKTLNEHNEYLETTKFNLLEFRKKFVSLDKEEEERKQYLNDFDKKLNEKMNQANKKYFEKIPIPNKIIIVRNIKEYDYSLYKKDIDYLNGELKKGWVVMNCSKNEFVTTYLLGYPLKVEGSEKNGF